MKRKQLTDEQRERLSETRKIQRVKSQHEVTSKIVMPPNENITLFDQVVNPRVNTLQLQNYHKKQTPPSLCTLHFKNRNVCG